MKKIYILVLAFLLLSQHAYANTACNIAEPHDSYVLAISWHPGFCKEHPDKEECKRLKPNDYANSNFSLVGLWPNKAGCGTHYGFCDPAVQDRKNFCDFPDLNWSDHTRDKVQKYMPSLKHNPCLAKHEWWKHGVCSGHHIDHYFSTATALVNDINTTSFANFIRHHRGKLVKRNQVNAEFDKSFGANAHTHMTLQCYLEKNNAYLKEIHIQLPQEIDLECSLAYTLQKANTATDQGNCGAKFRIAGKR